MYEYDAGPTLNQHWINVLCLHGPRRTRARPRWPIIVPTLVERLLFAGILHEAGGWRQTLIGGLHANGDIQSLGKKTFPWGPCVRNYCHPSLRPGRQTRKSLHGECSFRSLSLQRHCVNCQLLGVYKSLPNTLLRCRISPLSTHPVCEI